MSMLQTVKDHPAKIALGSASSIIAIVAALFALDARYAHAKEVDKIKVEYIREIDKIKMETKDAVKETTLTLRKQILEDKLFELDLKRLENRNQRLSPMDQALYDRYKRHTQEIEAKLK